MFISKLIISVSLILFTSWLSGKRGDLAGFIVSLPLVTLLVLPFSHFEFNDPVKTTYFAKSIFLAVPLSLLFFVPFLLAEKFKINFWACYSSGILLLGVSYLLHKQLLKYIA